ncbi:MULTISPECIES: hypothetical protein [Vagococcus]|uniref:Lipoprotein n=1 Tax=Vagococcus fluvialis bH819 TaxID=1255619 RepID=A0A1X6WPA5_9ENTE|nr:MULTISPECIES: hypothetical protein [Vagococcus]SLM86163.1 hypothetical protein FM121_08745 [Vagococcus fluvialis bH819]HCM90411.1 hypothetical protein [Vagococcus sp.]
MKKKLVLMTLSAVILGNMAACQSKPKKEETKTSQTEQVATEDNKVTGQQQPPTREEVVSLMPDIAKKSKKIMIDNSEKIHPKFNMKDKQILIVSNIGKTAYLVNSQDEKYGKKDDVVEYSTDTITNKDIMTGAFGETEFNGKKTYFLNIDSQMFMLEGNKEKKVNVLVQTILHESIHKYLQPKLEKGESLASLESTANGVKRALTYPIPYEERIYRAQQTFYYREAVKAKTEEERVSNIKKGNYFYKKYLEANPENEKKAVYDRIEGQPAYSEARGIATTSEKANDEKSINDETISNILKDNRVSDEMIQMGMEDMEYYAVGELAYANVLQLNQMKEIQDDNQNPVKYLYEKYGVEENKGNEKLSAGIKEQFTAQNNQLKQQVEGVDEKVKSPDYVKVKVRITDEQLGFEMHTGSVNYKFKENDATIETISREVKLGENRLKLTQSELIKTMEGDKEVNYLMVPKKDVEIKGDKVSIQSKDVQVFDQTFKKDRDILKLN